MTRSCKLDPVIINMLDASGVDWTLEPGSKHTQLRVAGRLVLTIPQKFREIGNTVKNARAAVRRHLRQHHGVEK